MKRTLAVLSRRVPWSITQPATRPKRLWWLCWYVEILWEPRDLWLGVYWNRPQNHERDLELYICLLPCLPIRVSLWDDSDVPF